MADQGQGRGLGVRHLHRRHVQHQADRTVLADAAPVGGGLDQIGPEIGRAGQADALLQHAERGDHVEQPRQMSPALRVGGAAQPYTDHRLQQLETVGQAMAQFADQQVLELT